MKKAQWITAGISFIVVISLYAFTQKQFFGPPRKNILTKSRTAASSFTIDTFLNHVKEHLTPDQITRLNFQEQALNRETDPSEKIHLYHQLSRFWKDSVRLEEQHESFEPFAWYTAEAARLENSEKSLTFAARLFWNALKSETNPEAKKWKALQAKDLYERSLKINPSHDSLLVELGEVHVYGGFALPMEGISMIRKVTEQNDSNVYAHLALAYASIASEQTDKAIERLKKVVSLDPANLQANLLLADIYERAGDKKSAVEWYKKSVPLMNPQFKTEVEERIEQLNK